MKVFGVIYLLIDGTNDKEYVGQTTNLRSRLNNHKRADQRIDRAIRAHGWENFVVVILKECNNKEELDRWERHFIKSRDTRSPNGYNLTDGGEGTVGIERTPEYCANIAASLTGKPFTPERCANIAASKAGKKPYPITPEHLANLSASLKGKTRTQEHGSNLSISKRGPSPFKNLQREMDILMFSYRRLAKRMGISNANINRKMRGERRFTARDAVKLEEIFGKPAEYFLERFPLTETNELVVDNHGVGVCKNLLDEMEKQGVTLHQLAELLGVIEATVYMKLRGERKFTARDAAKLEEIFGKPATYLLQRTEA